MRVGEGEREIRAVIKIRSRIQIIAFVVSRYLSMLQFTDLGTGCDYNICTTAEWG